MIKDDKKREAFFFPSDERSTDEEISVSSDEVRRHILKDDLLRTILDSVFSMILIVDSNFQAVHANRSFLEFFGMDTGEAVMGLGLGEILHCVHVVEGGGRCGCSPACDQCGVTVSIKGAMSGDAGRTQESRIECENGESFDFEMTSSDIAIGDERYMALVIRDISDRKRRQELESIFFHDVLNMSTVIFGFASLLKEGQTDKSQEIGRKIYLATRRLVDEIEYQRILFRAETEELSVQLGEVNSLSAIREAAEHYTGQQVTRGKAIKVDDGAEEIVIISDAALINSVLINMLKNALEASAQGDVVTLGCREVDGMVEFWVHNPGYIPQDIQHKIFNRPVSTKGIGRGIGTYSIKYISQNYLEGMVSFESSREGGTVFRARYPKVLHPEKRKDRQGPPNHR